MTPLNTDLITPHLASDDDEESTDMASWNHSWVQLQLAKTLLDLPDYTPSIELSLDISQADLSQFNLSADRELKPDICLYSAAHRGFKRPTDLLRMTEMPLATIEILSPKQGTYDLKEKIKAYFFLGVKSCWLVIPEVEIVTVYSSIDQFNNFNFRGGDTEVIDEVLKLRVPLANMFN